MLYSNSRIFDLITAWLISTVNHQPLVVLAKLFMQQLNDSLFINQSDVVFSFKIFFELIFV